MSVGVELLHDIQEIFDTQGIDKIFTSQLILSLCDDEEKPWATYNRGKPISPKQVSSRLGGYGIKSKDVRIKYDHKKGFERSQFEESFNRYLSIVDDTPPYPPLLSVTTRQTTDDVACSVTKGKIETRQHVLSATTRQIINSTSIIESVTDKTRQHGNKNLSETLQATNGAGCHVVADRPPPETRASIEKDSELF